MNIEDKKVVSFHYTLSNAEGEEMETSRERDPMSYLHGAGNIIPGLEKAMAGKTKGEQFEVTVEPADAYGERDENGIQRVPAKHFKNVGRLEPGQPVIMHTEQGQVQVTVVKVGRFNVDIDRNHPLAGQSLTFDVEITDVRDATAEEISHGHVHGPGGVNH
ncbi:MAG: peptidylprolyl isomerase [Xanthomonadales bacterium]|nr:peptidylprolyl isomerase [Gammaproteobacteria bacterium]MBT8054332.1 peptidylprolyl isomerase [Gammaproteobacteria bacterium]NND57475.1 peptidylprolyl isomerase [Xanthomonadales bacterium]NNK51199.1 peptidylprolyl isomerase [Xanthomonadales bacterium]